MISTVIQMLVGLPTELLLDTFERQLAIEITHEYILTASEKSIVQAYTPYQNIALRLNEAYPTGGTVERLTQLKEHLKPNGSGPVLWRANGCGFTFYGWMKEELLEPHIIKMHWFTFLWLPIFPLAVYVVDRGDVDQYRIFRRMSLWRFHQIYWGRLTPFYLTVMGESVLWIVGIITALAFTVLVLAALKHGSRAFFR